MIIFLKLGGSLITDKTGVEVVRAGVLARLAEEIGAARERRPELKLVLGHGSGSFGHVAGQAYGTRDGVHDPAGWFGFAAVAAAAARLNRLVVEALLAAGLPAVSLPPSASAHCRDGRLESLDSRPIVQALAAGLLPVVYGDVAFDAVRGGTIVSTEEVLTYLAGELAPAWLLLAGETDGVYDAAGQVTPLVTPDTFPAIAPALGGSRGTDVTGGMAAKVQEMLALAEARPGLAVRIFSGLAPGSLQELLERPSTPIGTLLQAGVKPAAA